MPQKLEHVNYDCLDSAKNAFIAASRRTLSFAKDFGFAPSAELGASANVFALDLKPFLRSTTEKMYVTLVPEGLGTADDARPDDLTSAELTHFWFNIGIKTVSVMTNDSASSGMQPILIGLYLPSSTPETVFTEEFMTGFLDGFVEGCKQVKCVYFSGETPQLKNKIYPNKLDIAGALFGLIPADTQPISGQVHDGDQIVFIQSSGPHENGFTSLRALAEKLSQGYRTKISDGTEYWQAINAASVLYTPLVQALLKAKIPLNNVENITGHGWQKIMRPKGNFEYRIHSTLPATPVFKFVEQQLSLTPAEMIKIFNYGVGMALYLPDLDSAKKATEIAKDLNLNSIIAGEVKKSNSRSVVVEPYQAKLSGEDFKLQK